LFFSQERKRKKTKDCPLSLKIGVKEILNYRKKRKRYKIKNITKTLGYYFLFHLKYLREKWHMA